MLTAKTDQTGRMFRLTRVFAGCTGHFVVIATLQAHYRYLTTKASLDSFFFRIHVNIFFVFFFCKYVFANCHKTEKLRIESLINRPN